MAASLTGDLLGLDQPAEGRSNNPGLTLNLGSNNPFRNRAVSPNNRSPAPASPFDDPPPRPTSKNPFLDLPDDMSSSKDKASPTAEDIFNNLTLNDGTSSGAGGKPPMPSTRPPGPPGPPRPRGENIPPHGRGGPPVHRPTRSQEEAMRARRPSGHGAKPSGGSPQRKPVGSRPRRNSDSSIVEKEKPLTEEEKKAKEARRRERERRHREAKSGKDSKGKPSKKLDVIDQLDATSIYGTGLFHHDGPFDACNPNRNRQGSRRAPMHAFAIDSPNMALGGSGPLNKRPDHATFMGNHDDEAFTLHASGVGAAGERRVEKPTTAFFDATARSSILHGDESLGLGTSTFLEGAPAARATIQRRQAETVQESTEGLGRKKSLAHRIRNINRAPQVPGRLTNPEGIYGPRSGDSTGERNPFVAEFDKADERISVKRTDSHPLSPSSPPVTGAVLERRVTSDATAGMSSPEPTPKSQGGFLSRVRSLKGNRRTRPDAPPQPSPGYQESASGTAA
ncbi:Pal1 cell morphology protein [Microdochium nivale]|nr:Pal1 cell morphology protein [Microdochium nivale]